MFVNYVENGVGHGDVGSILQEVRYEPGLLRPYLDEKNRPCVTVNTGRTRYDDKLRRHVPIQKRILIRDLQNRGINSPVFNATTLRKEDWIKMDEALLRSTRQRLAAWSDLAAANPFGGFDGMAKMTLEYEAMSDPGEAFVDMDVLAGGRTDAPLFKLRSLPLPITHADFWFGQRRLAVARGGTPLDTTMIEACGRRIAETVEQTTIGTTTGVTYGTQTAGYGTHDGTSTVYGYTNFPSRITKTNVTVPTGLNPNLTVSDVLAMRNSLYAAGFFGPYVLYHSTDWDLYMDNDYGYTTGSAWGLAPNQTLRQRLRNIGGISRVARLDYLTSTFTFIMVQMTSDVARAVIGLEPTVVQWPTMGGMMQNFKVMAILVPQLRADYSGDAGILHATTA